MSLEKRKKGRRKGGSLSAKDSLVYLEAVGSSPLRGCDCSSTTARQTREQKEDRVRSEATLASGAPPLSPRLVKGELPCSKEGMRGPLRVLHLKRVLHDNGPSLSKLVLLEAAHDSSLSLRLGVVD